jgi:hypothetical protein
MPSTDSFSGSIADDAEATLQVSSARADAIHVLIDAGTRGDTPAEYTITHDTFSSELDRYQFYQSESTRTDRAWRFEAVGANTQIKIKNTSGSGATYDITVIAKRYGS